MSTPNWGRILSFVCLSFALCLFLSACGGGAGKLTKANYDKIKDGETKEEEVKSMFGAATDTVQEEMPMIGKMNGSRWKSGEMEVVVFFKDGKVIGKTQKGLK